jgi:hypothetical protein
VNEKLTKIKNKIKQNAPTIAASAVAVVATAYAISLRKNLAEEQERFPEGKGTYLAINEDAKKELDEGKPQIWKINGHIIDVQYDPKF